MDWGDEHAAAAAKKALEHSDDPTMTAGLARLLLLARDFDEAIKATNRALEQDPHLAEALATRGAAHAQLGQYREAEQDLEAAAKALGFRHWFIDTLVSVHLREGWNEYQGGNLPVAQQHFERAVKLDASQLDAHRMLGEVLRLRGDNLAALNHLDRALELMGTGHHPDRAWTLATRGQVLRNLGQLGAAEQSLREALGIDNTLSWAGEELGALLRSSGRPEAAVKILRQAVDIDPNKATEWTSLGASYAELELYRDALDSLENALSLQPGDPWTLAIKGSVLLDQDQLEDALATFNAALDGDCSGLGWAQLRYGLILELLGKPLEDVESAYKKAVTLDPEDKLAKARLADVWLILNRIPEAESLWREIVGKRGRVPPASESALVGWSLMRLRHYREAAAALGAASAEDTTGVGSYCDMTGVSNYFDQGLNFLLWGRSEQALDYWAEGIRRVRGVPNLGRKRFLFRVARHELEKTLQDPRGHDVDIDAVAAIQKRLEDAHARIVEREARRGRSDSR